MLLSDTIKRTRIEKGITPDLIPGLLKISLRDYKAIENGVIYPTLNCLLRLSEVFKTSPTYLLTGNEKYYNRKMLHLSLTKDDMFFLWFYKWLYQKRNEICYQQIVAYSSLSKRALIEFGELTLDEISSSMIKEFLSELTDDISQKTIGGVKSVIKQVYDFAISEREYDFNPAIYCKVPNKAERPVETKIITTESRKSILALKHEMQPAAVIMMLAGLRRGEVLALRWCDVNFENNYIDVNKAIEIVHGIPVLKNHTKTDAGMRKVDMIPTLIAALKEHRRDNPNISDEDLILGNKAGNYCSTKCFYKKWDEYILDLTEKANLKEYFTSKQLRHYFASLCYMSGMDVKSTSKLMGHSKPEVTLKIYVHLDKIFKRESVIKLERYIA